MSLYQAYLGYPTTGNFWAFEQKSLKARDGVVADVDTGTAAVFVPGQPKPIELIRATLHRMAGGPAESTLQRPVHASTGGLLTFSISE